MRRAELPGFRPSIHGFRFANRWPSAPALSWRLGPVRLGLADAADGLCGGMAFAAADRFLAGVTVPGDLAPPAAGSPLFREIVRRQVASLGWLVVPLRFWLASIRLRAGRWTARHQLAEWRAIAADLGAGRPAMVGLVRTATASPLSLTRNHQVLAWAVEADATSGALRVYDPNHPARDDVAVTIRRDGRALSLAQTTGEPLRALLRLPYRPASPPAAAPEASKA